MSCHNSSKRRIPRTSRLSSFTRSTPPKLRSAANLASSGLIPRTMFSSISLSRWKRTSSSSSSSILDLNKSARNRSLSLLSMTISSHSGRFQNQFHRPGESSPGLGLRRQLFPAGGGQFVIFGLPVVLRRPPLRGDPALRLQPVQRRIQRPLAHPQYILRNPLYALCNVPSVSRPGLKCLEY